MEFMRLRPPAFDNSVGDPLTADDWLRDINKKLELVAANDREKVALAAHQLIGSAAEWWNNYKEAATNVEAIH